MMNNKRRVMVAFGLAGCLLLASARAWGTPSTVDYLTFEQMAVQASLALKAKDAEIKRADTDLDKAKREAEQVDRLEKYNKSDAYTKATIREVVPLQKEREKLRLDQERKQLEEKEKVEDFVLWQQYDLSLSRRQWMEQKVQDNEHQRQILDAQKSVGVISALEYDTRVLALQPTQDDVAAQQKQEDLDFQRLKAKLYTLKTEDIVYEPLTPSALAIDEQALRDKVFAQDLVYLRSKDTLEFSQKKLELAKRYLTESSEDQEILGDLSASVLQQQAQVDRNHDELDFAVSKAVINLQLRQLEMNHLRQVYQLADRQYQVDKVKEIQGNLPGGSKASELKKQDAYLNYQQAVMAYEQQRRQIEAGNVREDS